MREGVREEPRSTHTACTCDDVPVFPAGHDSSILPQRAWGPLEFELQIHAGLNLHIHRLHSDCCQPLRLPSPYVWSTHDGAVQGTGPGGAVPPRLCHSRLGLQADAEGFQEPVHSGAARMYCLKHQASHAGTQCYRMSNSLPACRKPRI